LEGALKALTKKDATEVHESAKILGQLDMEQRGVVPFVRELAKSVGPKAPAGDPAKVPEAEQAKWAQELARLASKIFVNLCDMTLEEQSAVVKVGMKTKVSPVASFKEIHRTWTIDEAVAKLQEKGLLDKLTADRHPSAPQAAS
jgi:hypothetical protein